MDNYNNEHTSYCISKNAINDNDFVIILYKNMCIKWNLEKFSQKEICEIVKQIQDNKHITYKNRYFICNNKWGWNKMEKLLMSHYYNNINELPNNLIFLSLYNFISKNNTWQNDI